MPFVTFVTEEAASQRQQHSRSTHAIKTAERNVPAAACLAGRRTRCRQSPGCRCPQLRPPPRKNCGGVRRCSSSTSATGGGVGATGTDAEGPGWMTENGVLAGERDVMYITTPSCKDNAQATAGKSWCTEAQTLSILNNPNKHAASQHTFDGTRARKISHKMLRLLQHVVQLSVQPVLPSQCPLEQTLLDRFHSQLSQYSTPFSHIAQSSAQPMLLSHYTIADTEIIAQPIMSLSSARPPITHCSVHLPASASPVSTPSHEHTP